MSFHFHFSQKYNWDWDCWVLFSEGTVQMFSKVAVQSHMSAMNEHSFYILISICNSFILGILLLVFFFGNLAQTSHLR